MGVKYRKYANEKRFSFLINEYFSEISCFKTTINENVFLMTLYYVFK